MQDYVHVMLQKSKLKELRDICKEMHKIEDATARVEVNSRFHTMIAHYSGNERIVDYLASSVNALIETCTSAPSMQCVHMIAMMNMIKS